MHRQVACWKLSGGNNNPQGEHQENSTGRMFVLPFLTPKVPFRFPPPSGYLTFKWLKCGETLGPCSLGRRMELGCDRILAA